MKTDIEIAQEAEMMPIKNVAEQLGITEDDIELYGKYKAKISNEYYEKIKDNEDGKLILVTAINPTPAGEGKTTVTVGLGEAFGQLNKKAVIALREPSLGPCFGIKGGAAGGGYAQVVPMEDMNLHFTGDFHAITSANNLLAAMLDNSIQQGNVLNIDPNQVVWKRCVDMNDRVLRNVVVGLGRKVDGTVREDHFVITVASEIMAILCLATSYADLKERLELISKYSNNSLVRNLSVSEKLFLYETKRVFDIHYFNTKPAHALFLDSKFKTKYICDTELSREERKLDVEKIVNIIKEKHIVAEEVYELQNAEEQIRFELFKVIQNNFTINKCENCGRLFIPVTSSNNPNQKGRNDQKYCDNLYLDTEKTCKEIGALNKQKEKVQNSPILIEYNREYKRMHGLHYNHQKKFTEKKFKEWSKKARKLRDNFTDDQLEEFKMELKKLSDIYWE